MWKYGSIADTKQIRKIVSSHHNDKVKRKDDLIANSHTQVGWRGHRKDWSVTKRTTRSTVMAWLWAVIQETQFEDVVHSRMHAATCRWTFCNRGTRETRNTTTTVEKNARCLNNGRRSFRWASQRARRMQEGRVIEVWSYIRGRWWLHSKSWSWHTLEEQMETTDHKNGSPPRSNAVN